MAWGRGGSALARRAPPLPAAMEGDRRPNMSELFISYHRPDREAVDGVRRLLKAQGIR
jgi:hypothetical protein